MFGSWRHSKRAHLWNLTCLCVLNSSCGSDNAFEEIDQDRRVEDVAARALEKNETLKAQELLLGELGDPFRSSFELSAIDITTVYTNEVQNRIAARSDAGPSLRLRLSLLSQAVALEFGIDPLTIALQLGTDSGGTTSSGTANGDTADDGSSNTNQNNVISALFPVLPEATPANIEGFDKAQAILNSLPESLLTTADTFKKAILLTTGVSLRSKRLDTDGDGEISVSEAINLSVDDAQNLFNQLGSAAETIAGIDLGAEGSTAAATAAVTNILAEIQAQPGATDEERLRNYIAQSSGN